MINKIDTVSRAKLNWLLKVEEARPDGYHELETVFQELEVGERVSISAIDEPVCQLSGFPSDIDVKTNLVTRAWESMRSLFPRQVRGISFAVEKTLPHGGGLGGGSSNCACAIKAINTLFGVDAPVSQLQEIGGQIGADVAFFIEGGTAIGRGRGEILEQVERCPQYWLVLLTPPVGMSTGAAYGILDTMRARPGHVRKKSPNMTDFLAMLRSGAPDLVGPGIYNDFELVSEQYVWFQQCRDSLQDAGAVRAFLCGSGSTVAGLAADEASARRIAAAVGGIATATHIYA